MKKLVAFGAHHDDIEIRAGGTVAKYAAMGYEITYVVAIDSVYIDGAFSTPEKSFHELTHDDILNIRENESRQGAKILGAREPVFLHIKPSFYWTSGKTTHWRVHFHDDDDLIANMKKYKGRYFCLQAANSPECVGEVRRFLEEIGPEIVLTQQPNDFHPEHYAVSALVFAACRKLAEQGQNIKLYAWEMGSRGKMLRFVPDAIIDITDYMDKKIEAVRPFISQVAGSDILSKYIIKSAEFWGAKAGVKYAEPFSEMLINCRVRGFDLDREDFESTSGSFVASARTL